MKDRLKLPIGIEDFRDIRREGFYYVDKTGLIEDLLSNWGMVNLFTRPRRFGKSLNISMLKNFFEIGMDPALFEGLAVSRNQELCQNYMGKFPVISLSLKGMDASSYDIAREMAAALVSEEARRLQFLLDSQQLTALDKDSFLRLTREPMSESTLRNSLKTLSALLHKHYGKKTIILLDEYDVPLAKASSYGYYDQMVDLIRGIFGNGLKTNEHLYFAVLTGCLRIARESIFTGLNNFKINSISDVDCAEYFGFTDREVQELLQYYGVEARFADMKDWYDGYHFGNVDVYCPWDVINQCDRLRKDPQAEMASYWVNSSENSIIRDLLQGISEATKAELEALISGQFVEKRIFSELTYADLKDQDRENRQTNLWSILYASGYLTDAAAPRQDLHKLVIPNKEVLGIYDSRISSWFRRQALGNSGKWRDFCQAICQGDAEKVEKIYNDFLMDSISIRDTSVRKEMKENFYHGMLLGLLKAEESWVVLSNVESGVGYTDIVLIVPNQGIGCIFEVKYAENGSFDEACQEALKQIEEKGYVSVLRREEAKRIYKYGIACYKKSCRVLCVSESWEENC